MPYVDENDATGGTNRPVVVLIECDRKVFLELGGSSLFNKQIYGIRAHFNQVPDTRSHYRGRDWVLGPEEPSNMLQILTDHPKFTLGRARTWIASESFVRSARATLIQSMSEWGGGGGSTFSTRKFNKRWAERVRVVIFGAHVDVDSEYVKRIFENWFPNATFAKHTGERDSFGGGFQAFKIDIWAGGNS